MQQASGPSEVGAASPPAADWRARLTIIVTTSPLPRHPCSLMLERRSKLTALLHSDEIAYLVDVAGLL